MYGDKKKTIMILIKILKKIFKWCNSISITYCYIQIIIVKSLLYIKILTIVFCFKYYHVCAI